MILQDTVGQNNFKITTFFRINTKLGIWTIVVHYTYNFPLNAQLVFNKLLRIVSLCKKSRKHLELENKKNVGVNNTVVILTTSDNSG